LPHTGIRQLERGKHCRSAATMRLDFMTVSASPCGHADRPAWHAGAAYIVGWERKLTGTLTGPADGDGGSVMLLGERGQESKLPGTPAQGEDRVRKREAADDPVLPGESFKREDDHAQDGGEDPPRQGAGQLPFVCGLEPHTDQCRESAAEC